MFSITGSTMKQATSPPASTRSSASGSLYGMTIVSARTALVMPAVPGTAIGRVGRAGLVERRLHRDHHLVVVAVVAALDLDDAVPAGRALGDADGVHRRLGAGVGEAPHRQAVAVAEQLGDLGVELARRDVQRAVVELGLRRRPARPGACGRRTGRRSPCRSRRTRCRRRRPSGRPAAWRTTIGCGS